MLNTKYALVTGGAGFIGSNLVKSLLKKGYNVDIVDDMSSGHKEFLPNEIIKNNLFIHDFASDFVCSMIQTKKYDVVFHLAAIPRVSYSIEHPLETNNVNVSKTLQLMNACRDNIKRFVFASSSSVYGGADILPTPSSHYKSPKSPYALQKSIIEDYLNLYNLHYGFDSCCMRFFNVFGPNQLGSSPYSTAISSWLTAIKSNELIRFDGDGSQSRDMCYVDNVVDACIRAAEVPERLNASCFNVACGDRTTNKEILNYLLSKYPNAKYYSAPWRAGDVMHTHADISTTTLMTGYTPLVRFWEGLEQTINWFNKDWDIIKDLK